MKRSVVGLLLGLGLVVGCAKEDTKPKATGGTQITAPGVSIKADESGAQIKAPGVEVNTKK
jgi:hypothetical protein